MTTLTVDTIDKTVFSPRIPAGWVHYDDELMPQQEFIDLVNSDEAHLQRLHTVVWPGDMEIMAKPQPLTDNICRFCGKGDAEDELLSADIPVQRLPKKPAFTSDFEHPGCRESHIYLHNIPPSH